ncbi:MAG: hypothetical protein JWL77_6764 [Chthonomonadaceae bacterium]|nr:hypothetical protein [Chthonomonadaceae bacterium]
MTTTQPIESRRAKDRDEIAPLLDLCRAGRLFDVQAWIAAGKPVNPPARPPKGARVKAPLDVSLDLGFHSLIEVLLKAGAEQDPPNGYGSGVGCRAGFRPSAAPDLPAAELPRHRRISIALR